MPRFVDFDAAWEEAEAREEKPPPRIKVLGEVVDLPRSMPASVVLESHRRDPDEKLTLEYCVDRLNTLVGDDVVQGWIDKRLGQRQLFDIFMMIGLAYRNDSELDAEGEAQPPATGADGSTTSSTAGTTSKPTGSASTAPSSAEPSSSTE